METDWLQNRVIAIVGGTGKEGKGLAYRWSLAGLKVIIGSRQLEKAVAAAAEVTTLCQGRAAVAGLTNEEAVKKAEIIVLTVPYAAHQDTLELIKPLVNGKTVVDVTVPLVPPLVTVVQVPPTGSVAKGTKEFLGETVEVISAFQNISYENLLKSGEPIDCDVLVCGDSKIAREKGVQLVAAAGLVGRDAGPLENSIVAEGLTSILIGINKQFGVKASGIRITGLPDS